MEVLPREVAPSSGRELTMAERKAVPSDKRSAVNRPRGRRKRGNPEQRFTTVNSSGSPQLVSAAALLSKQENGTVAIFNQEHLTWKKGAADLQKKLRDCGWKIGMCPAAAGAGGGASAGTAIVVPSTIGFDAVQGRGWGHGSGTATGRVTAAWVQGGLRGGILCISVYLWTGEGMSLKNKGILATVGDLVIRHKGPWVMGGDLNMTPAVFRRDGGAWLERVGGSIAAAGVATNRPAGGAHRELDYFIVDRWIAHTVVKVEVDLSLDTKPHRAVTLVVRPAAANQLTLVLRRPRAFPRSKPTGCARRPVVPASACRFGKEAKDEAKETMGKAWKEIIACAEVELCGICDSFKGDLPDGRYLGRANGARKVQTWSLPQRAAGKDGALDAVAYAFSWAATRMREMALLGRKAGRGWEDDDRARAKQWAALHDKFLWPNPLLRKAAEEVGEFWECLQFAARGEVTDWEEFEAWAKWAENMAGKRKAEAVEGARKAWREFIAKGLAPGGGSLHAFAKRAEEHQGESVQTEDGRSGTPRDIVLEEAKDGDRIWSRFQGSSAAPWREADLAGLEPLARPTVAELRRCARSFRSSTAIGCDSLVPRWVAWLSDELLEAFISFLTSIEDLGCWPHEVAQAIIHLIPKASGGRRPIGVLATVTRIWESMRKPVVWQWRAKHTRPYNWATAGRSAEAAVWGQALRDEVARAKGKACGAVLYDLVKEYEYVRLELVWEAGLQMEFPAVILRLLMEIYAFVRTLVYRGALADGIETLSAILAGSVFAMDALAMVLTGAVGRIILTLPNISVVLYVDDPTAHAREDSAEEVASVLDECTGLVIEALEDELGMRVSRAGDGRQPRASDKTVAVGSSAEVRKKLKRGVGSRGIHVRKNTLHLGSDYSAGAAGRSKQGQRKRLVAAREKMPRVRRLGAVGGPHVFRTGVVQAIRYGSATVGFGAAALQAVRAMGASARGPMQRRSTTARLAIHGEDPAIAIVITAIRYWAEALWTGDPDFRTMVDAWRGGQEVVGVEKSSPTGRTGAAASYLAAVKAIGWRSPAPHLVTTLDGSSLDLRVIAPKTVRRWATDDWYIKAAASSTVADDINDASGSRGYGMGMGWPVGKAVLLGQLPSAEADRSRALKGQCSRSEGGLVPWFEPLRMLVRAAKKKGKESGAGLRSIIAMGEGGWWTQLRRCAEGLSDHPYCMACGPFVGWPKAKEGAEVGEYGKWWEVYGDAEDENLGGKASQEDISWGENKEAEAQAGCKVGSVAHRLLQCPAASAVSKERERARDRVKEDMEGRPWDPLYWRGVPAVPQGEGPPPFEEHVWRQGAETERLAQGTAFTDGACRGFWRKTKRAGWGACVVDGEGNIQWGIYGTCPDAYASSLRAELWAVLGLIRYAVPPLAIGVDNAEVVEGWRAGSAFCCNPKREGADLWRNIWSILRDIGEGGISVFKVKAHLAMDEVQAGTISLRDWRGNAAADRMAVRGAMLAERKAPREEGDGHLKRALRFYRWAVEAVADWREDTDRDRTGRGEATENKEGGPPKVENKRKPAEIPVHPVFPHCWWQRLRGGAGGGGLLCRRCGRDTGQKADPKQVMRSACRGSATERAQRLAGADMKGRAVFRFSAGTLRLRGYRPTGESGGVAEGSVAAAQRRRRENIGPGWTRSPQLSALREGEQCGGEDSPSDEGQKRRRMGGEEIGSARGGHAAVEAITCSTRKELIGRLSEAARAGGGASTDEGPSGTGRGVSTAGQGLLQKALQDRSSRQRSKGSHWLRESGRRGKGPREGAADAARDGPEAVRKALTRLVQGSAPSGALDRWGSGRALGGGAVPRAVVRAKRRAGAGEGASSRSGSGPTMTGTPVAEAPGGQRAGDTVAAQAAADGEREKMWERRDTDAGGGAPGVRVGDGEVGDGGESVVFAEVPEVSSGARPRTVVGRGHRLVRTGAILWCNRCGAHAEARVGTALAGACRPVAEGEKSGRASRRGLLQKGKHPITRRPLDGPESVTEVADEVYNTEAFEEPVHSR